MKIKPMGEANKKKLLSEMMENAIKNEMKLNSLFGFDINGKCSTPAYAMVRLVCIDTGKEHIFCDFPIDDVEFFKEYCIHPDYRITELEKDENGNSIIPGFRSMDKEVTIDFETISIDREDNDLKITMRSILSVINSNIGAPEKIEISSTSDNVFTIYGSDYYVIITLVPSSMATPILKIINVTDIIMSMYAEELDMIDDDDNMDKYFDPEYDVLSLAEELDPDGEIFKTVIVNMAEGMWFSDWLYFEIGSYDNPCGVYNNDTTDSYSSYEIVYNSYHAKFTSKIIDTKTNEVKDTYKDLPMLMYKFDFDNWLKYAEHEDLSRVVVPKYYYSNENGVTVEITPESNGHKASYKMFYNSTEYYNKEYSPIGIPFGFSPFDYEPNPKDKLNKNSNEYKRCVEIVNLLPEIARTKVEVYKMKDKFYAVSNVGSVKIAKDFSSLFFAVYCADSVNFQSKILLGLHDLKKDRKIFVSTLGISNSVINMQDDDKAQSSVHDCHIYTSTMLADSVELSVENIISLVMEGDTGFILRTINNPAEGKVTVEIKDKESKASLVQKESVFFNETKGIIYVRDMFGVPTPIQLA